MHTCGQRVEFSAREAFRGRDAVVPTFGPGILLREEAFRIEAVTLDHGIPCLAFALVETLRVNVWRGALQALGLPVGPWLNEAKRAVRLSRPDDTLIQVTADTVISLGELKALRVGRVRRSLT